MMMPECDHGSDPQCCVVCGPYAARPAPPPDDQIVARFPGPCPGPGCRGIEPGDRIVAVGDGLDSRWAHVRCTRTVAVTR